MRISQHARAVLLALFVTFLWSTSWVLIKFGLQDIPAITFAGLRYFIAFLALLPFALRRSNCQGAAGIAALREIPTAMWSRLVILGLLYYAVTQGAQFLGLLYLPAITNSLLLSFTAVLVVFFGIIFLDERPSPLQWGGVALYVIGIALYFLPQTIPPGHWIGYAVIITGVLANALSAILGRAVNRAAVIPPVLVTVISMGVGAVTLLAAGMIFQGLPRLSLLNWAIILWLAVINSALAFTLWNASLRTLSAMESSIINNTMLFQIAVLAWVFLGERLDAYGIAGMLLAGFGTMLVQLRRRT